MRDATSAVPVIAGVIAAGMGSVVLLGWLVGDVVLISIVPGLATMKVNTAIGLLLCGVSLIWAARRSRRVGDWVGHCLAGVVIIIGLLAALEYLLGVDLGVDQFLIRDRITPDAELPGRMSFVAAVSFMLFGCGRIASGYRGRSAAGVQSISVLIGLLTSYVALLGYLYGAPPLYRPVPSVSIAAHTAIGFVILFSGLAALRPDLAFVARLRSRRAGATLVKWLLPAVLLVPVIGWLLLQGELAGLFGTRVAVALFVAVNVVALGAVAWFASAQADHLDWERARSLASLLENEARLRLAVQGPGIGIAEQDRDLRYTFMDMSLHEGPGGESSVRPEMFIGKTDYELFGTDKEFTAAKAAAIATGENLHREVSYGLVGTELWFEVWVVPRRNGSAEITGLLSSFIDITERRELALQLQHSQRMEAIGHLTGGIAHDFNNILAVVLGNMELLQDHVDASPLDKELLLDGIRAARRGAELTHRLLAYSRRQQLTPTLLDAGNVITGLAGVLRRLTEETIGIEASVASDLWLVRIDASQLENALLNLAVNARDAMPKGGRLTIAAENCQVDSHYADAAEIQPGAFVLLSISDTGTGMTKDVVARALEPFFTTKPIGQGTGLGLSMVYGFVKQSNGHLAIYSEPGVGTTIRIYLPRAEDGSVPLTSEEEIPSGSAAGKDQIVLVVEDDPDVRKLEVRLLSSLGYCTLEAEDGISGLAALEAAPRVDLLLTDVVLPNDMSGFSVANAARRLRPGLKVVFMSGYAHAAVLDPEVAHGATLLSKPFTRATLASAVREALLSEPAQ